MGWKNIPWSQAQREKERLAAAKSAVDHFFPGFVKWFDPAGDTKVKVTLRLGH